MPTFLAPARKVAYVAVPKVASTTLEWMIAELAGLPAERFHRALSLVPTREQTVHAAGQWPRHLRVSRPTPADAAASGVDPTWFVFSVVRDPRERLWSAWQSKFLVRRRRYVDTYGDEPWFPRIPREPATVIEDFSRFVAALADEAKNLMTSDAHFRRQAETVLDGPFTVSHLYELRDIPTLCGHLQTHLRAYGADVPELRRDNTMPFKLTADVLEDGRSEAIIDLYRDDFDRLGHLWPDQAPTAARSAWSEGAFVDVASRIDLHERVEDMSVLARDLREQRARLRSQDSFPAGT